MPLHPNLHLLIPSSTPLILLEARLYLPIEPASTSLPLFTSSRSTPISLRDLTKEIQSGLRNLGIERLVTAAHPWGKLGGHMLDPVIAEHLISAVFSDSDQVGPKTAVLSYNARDVGKSGGGSGWFGLPGEVDVKDYEAVEGWGLAVLGVSQLWRMGYSWGTLSAITPTDRDIVSTLLISPALFAFSALGYIPGVPSFDKDLERAVREGRRVWMAIGTKDEFTGVERFRARVEQASGGIVGREVDGASHFYRGEGDGEGLVWCLREWLRG